MAILYEPTHVAHRGRRCPERGREWLSERRQRTGDRDRDRDAADFTFETDGGTWEPGLPDTAGAQNYAVAGWEGGAVGYPSGTDGSYLAFAVQSPLSASNPLIRYAGTDRTWTLPETSQDRLEAPAAGFDLVELTVPDSVSEGTDLSVSLTVENVAETDGRFLAALYWPTNEIADDDESHIVERTVEPGGEVTESVDIDTRYTATEAEPIMFSVDGHVSAEREVELTDAGSSY